MRILSFSIPCSLYILISLTALVTLPALSKDSLKLKMLIKCFLNFILIFSHLASTSVETRPGTIFKISVPKRTSSLSMDSSNCSALVLINYARDIELIALTLQNKLLDFSMHFCADKIRSLTFSYHSSHLWCVRLQNKCAAHTCERWSELFHFLRAYNLLSSRESILNRFLDEVFVLGHFGCHQN